MALPDNAQGSAQSENVEMHKSTEESSGPISSAQRHSSIEREVNYANKICF